MRAKFLITYGDEFTEKPNSLYDFLIIGKIFSEVTLILPFAMIFFFRLFKLILAKIVPFFFAKVFKNFIKSFIYIKKYHKQFLFI